MPLVGAQVGANAVGAAVSVELPVPPSTLWITTLVMLAPLANAYCNCVVGVDCKALPEVVVEVMMRLVPVERRP